MDGNVLGVATQEGQIILVDSFGIFEDATMKILGTYQFTA